MTTTFDTLADLQRAEALVTEAAENWRSAERDLAEASNKYAVTNGRMLELSAEVAELEKRFKEASDLACLSLVQGLTYTKLFADADKLRGEQDRVSAAVQYVHDKMLPGLKRLDTAGRLAERRCAQRYHASLAELETAKAIHGAVAGGLVDSGVMLDMAESKAARYGAAAVELSREVERLEAELAQLS